MRNNRFSVGGMLFAALLGLLLALLVAALGCGPTVRVTGGQTHEVNVHHDDQKTKVDVFIHRDKRRNRRHSYLPAGAMIRTSQIHNGQAYFVWRDAEGNDHELTIPEADLSLVIQPGE